MSTLKYYHEIINFKPSQKLNLQNFERESCGFDPRPRHTINNIKRYHLLPRAQHVQGQNWFML